MALEVCAFKDSCPSAPDVIEIAGACSAERGKNCGRVAAYGMLKWRFEGLEALDEEGSIDGTFTITGVPSGFLPEEVRQDFDGVRLPIRDMERTIGAREIRISSPDIILGLISSGRQDAAAWFNQTHANFAPTSPDWVFQISEGEIQAEPYSSSMEFYGAGLSDTVRTALEQV